MEPMRRLGRLLAVVAAAAGIIAGLGSTGVAGADAVYQVANTGGWDLNVRSAPSLSASIIGELPAGATIDIHCQTWGDEVNGLTAVWDKLTSGGYVSDYYTTTPMIGQFTTSIGPPCPSSAAPSPPPPPATTPSPPPPSSPPATTPSPPPATTPSPTRFYDCPAAGQTTFPQINVPVLVPGSKSYSLSYGKLSLSWHSVSSAGGAQCSMQSSSGALPVIINLPHLGSVTVAHSVTTARLDFLAPGATPPVCDWINLTRNCSLDADGPLMVRWTTPGFEERVDGHTVYDTGPLTFYAQANSGDVAAQLQTTELHIHETLIRHLPLILQFALVQEPPADLWVRDAKGRMTGRTRRGRVLQQIPNSRYFTNKRGYAAVLLLTVRSRHYTTAAIGRPGRAYSLSLSSVSPLVRTVHRSPRKTRMIGTASVRSATKSGRLGRHGSSPLLRFVPND